VGTAVKPGPRQGDSEQPDVQFRTDAAADLTRGGGPHLVSGPGWLLPAYISRAATAVLGPPSAQAKTIRARSASPRAVPRRFAQFTSVRRPASDSASASSLPSPRPPTDRTNHPGRTRGPPDRPASDPLRTEPGNRCPDVRAASRRLKRSYSAIWRHAASETKSRIVTSAGLLLARKYPPYGAGLGRLT
jgi:hypothetical protein